MKQSQFHAVIGINALMIAAPKTVATGFAIGSLVFWLVALWMERKE